MQERNTPWNLWFLVGSYRQDQVMVMMTMMMMMMESLVKKPTHTELDMNCHPGDSLWPSWDAEVTLSKVKWPPTRGSKDHLESPGCVYFVVSVSIWILSLLRCEWTNWSNHWLLALFFAMYVLNTLYLSSMSLCKYCSMFVDVNATCTKYHCMYKFIIIYLFFIFRECGERPFCETFFLFDACFERVVWLFCYIYCTYLISGWMGSVPFGSFGWLLCGSTGLERCKSGGVHTGRSPGTIGISAIWGWGSFLSCWSCCSNFWKKETPKKCFINLWLWSLSQFGLFGMQVNHPNRCSADFV